MDAQPITSDLLIGCGSRREKQFNHDIPWGSLITLDINPTHKPDVVWDLRRLPLPFDDNRFDSIHAYEVLEHLGQQGDYEAFFAQFTELWRILKPGGVICATCPSWDDVWAWGDPSHSRIINQGTLAFLSQARYEEYSGETTMSDFRYIYHADFETRICEHRDGTFYFVLEAIKPARDAPHGK